MLCSTGIGPATNRRAMSEMPPPLPPEPEGTPQGAPAGLDAVKTADPIVLGIIAAGVLAFLCSFLPFYRVSVLGISDSANAWHDLDGKGFLGWFGCIIALVGAVVVALPLLKRPLPVDQDAAAVGAFGLAFVLLFLAIFINPFSGMNGGGLCDDDNTGICKQMLDGVSFGHAVGFWLAFVLVLVALLASGYRLLKARGRI